MGRTDLGSILLLLKNKYEFYYIFLDLNEVSGNGPFWLCSSVCSKDSQMDSGISGYASVTASIKY